MRGGEPEAHISLENPTCRRLLDSLASPACRLQARITRCISTSIMRLIGGKVRNPLSLDQRLEVRTVKSSSPNDHHNHDPPRTTYPYAPSSHRSRHTAQRVKTGPPLHMYATLEHQTWTLGPTTAYCGSICNLAPQSALASRISSQAPSAHATGTSYQIFSAGRFRLGQAVRNGPRP